MHRKRNVLIIATLLGILFSFQYSIQPVFPQYYTSINKLDTNRLHQLDNRIEQVLANYEYINVALVQDGDIVFAKSYGKNRMNKNDVYASVSKPVTAMILFQLLQESKINSLDDDISKYHARYENAIPGAYSDTVITFRQLLTHTSGVPHLSALWNGSKLKLAFKPGTGVEYSSHGYGILGDVMENITGITYKKLVKKYIGDPVDAYSFTVRHPFFDAPAGQVASTIEDMARFAIGVMNGTYIPSEMLTDQVLQDYANVNGEIIGLGWYCLNPNQNDVAGYHSGSNGRPRAFLAIKPHQQNAVALTGRNKSEEGAHDFGTLTIDLMAILENRY